MKKTVAKYLCIILSAALLLTALPLTVHAANTWDPDNGVYNITTEEDLFAFNETFVASGKYYEGVEVNLLSDITISEGKEWVSAPSNIGNELHFCGIFNGNNHTISNLNMVSSDNDTVSFLPFLDNAVIKDLTLNNVTIKGGRTWNAAFSSISVGNDTISNCHLTGNCVIKTDDGMTDSKSNYNGGIVSYKYSGNGGTLKIENCSVGDADSDIKINLHGRTTSTYRSCSGGVLGFVDQNCNVEITSTDNYADVGCDSYAGGIISRINKLSTVKIIDCLNYGDIYTPETNIGFYKCCGGLVGYEPSSSLLLIDKCANHGNVTVSGYSAFSAGGVAGEVYYGAVLNTYNTGKVTATNDEVAALGGLVGHFRVNDGLQISDTSGFEYYPTDYVNSIINCYNVGVVTGPQTGYVGGVCGYVQDFCTVEKRSVIRNAYNFAEISGLSPIGTVCGAVQDTTITDVYGKSGSYALNSIEINTQNTDGVETCISEVGYFDTPDVNGTVYPATVKAKGVDKRNEIIETISSAPLSGNLLSLLNEKVKEYNAELEVSGSDFRYLTWKMTNPASEDGSTGVSVHPMFGINDFTVNFYANFEDNEEPFRIYTVETLVNGKVPEFYDLPSHDGYIFKGWYLDKENSDDDSPISFDTVYSASTDIYAHWIKVEDVAKDEKDDNELPPGYSKYGGFDLAGVQVREGIRDTNYGYEKMPGGLRFVTSLNMDVVNQINAIKPNNIEYGYVAATNKGWIDYHSEDADRKLQYVSETANGIDTSATATDENYFGFASNIICTSRKTNGSGKVNEDHRNFKGYLLYTLVITYENVDESAKGTNVLARPYIRYSDANGLERVAYSEYRGNSNTLGGCYTSYNAIAGNN